MPYKRKGQKSLEMIIGMIILLVLAAIVINMMTQSLNPQAIPNKEKELAHTNFFSTCENLCNALKNDRTKLDFCTYRYTKDNDWNGNGIKNEKITIEGGIGWPVCEDAIYCFLVYPCYLEDGTRVTGEVCRELLCQQAAEIYCDVDPDMVNQSVHDRIVKGSCDLGTTKSENWYRAYGFNETGVCKDLVSC